MNQYSGIMKKYCKIVLNFKTFFLLTFVFIAFGCVEKNTALTTFKGKLVYSFLKNDTVYSEYVKIIDKAGLKGMLSAYGMYTCLAPTNSSFRSYYKSKGAHFTIDSLTQGQIDTIAKTHIIINKYLIYNLSDGVIPNMNMNKRYIEIKFVSDSIKHTLDVLLNNSSSIVSKDNEVYNGVVHGIDRVLSLSNYQLPDLMENDLDISIFVEALKLTHMSDSLRFIKDLTYAPVHTFKDESNSTTIMNPAERVFAYTALVESNEVFKANGINSLADLIVKADQLYPCEEQYKNDFTNRNNSLNKFISYHLVNKSIFYNKFFYTEHYVQNFVPTEFIETMFSNRIIKVSKINDLIVLNPESNHEVEVLSTGGKTTVNGVYHLINNILVYNNDVENVLLNSRIRTDISSLFPEMTNNAIRGSRITSGNQWYTAGDRYGFEQSYLTGLKMTKDTRLIYIGPNEQRGADDYQADQFLAQGPYDLTIRMLPVPPGTYELRYSFTNNSDRSITQFYVDGKPMGIPIDLRIDGRDPSIGYILDKETNDNGVENDKTMRNRGYLKAANSYLDISRSDVVRNGSNSLRRIIGTFTFTDYAPHYLRLKSVINNTTRECIMDYLEWVPKSIYDPVSGEPETRE